MDEVVSRVTTLSGKGELLSDLPVGAVDVVVAVLCLRIISSYASTLALLAIPSIE